MKTKSELDERQLQIQGKVSFHGYIIALSLLLANALLHSMDIVWASGFHQNILIMMLTSTIVGIEAILRGVYFGNGKSRGRLIGMFGLLSLVMLILIVQHMVQGEALIADGGLTGSGFSLVIGIMFVLMTIIAIAKELVERRQKSE